MTYDGIKLPSGVGKSVRQVYFFEMEDGTWLMRTKAVVIAKFECMEDGVNWWNGFNKFRGQKKPLKLYKPPARKRRYKSPTLSVHSSNQTKLCPVCNGGGNMACIKCGGSGLL